MKNEIIRADYKSLIYEIQGYKVMLDLDLANLYGVATKRLKEQVRRNIDRFPEDFMFILTNEEFKNLRSQFATSSWGGSRYEHMVFTEQGVAMLSSVLNSDKPSCSPSPVACRLYLISTESCVLRRAPTFKKYPPPF